MNILLTGATGFIGKNIFEYFSNTYNLYAPRRDELDLLESKEVEKYILDKKIDVVIHSANTNHVIHPEDKNNMLEYNLRMFFNLYNCSSLYKKLIYFGSGAEYNSNFYIPKMTESYLGCHIPTDSYGFSKYIMAQIAEKSENVYELCLFGVYGKYEEWRRRFISNVIYQAIKADEILINHNQVFDYLYIDDLMKIIEWFVKNNPKTHRYNICSGQSIELLTIANKVRDLIGKEKRVVIKENNRATDYTGDNSKYLEENIGFRFTEHKKAINELIDFYNYYGFE